MVLASQYLIDRRYRMKDFKLMTVAQEVGLVVDEARLHDANYDIELTRGVYRIVTGVDYEL
jgi:DNA polymerase-3 subunit epsilon